MTIVDRMPRLISPLVLALIGLILFGDGAYIHAKAWLAQVLLERAFDRSVATGQAVNFTSDYARQRYSLELALRGEPHGPYPDWVARFQEFDPWRVYFAHDTATWQRGGDTPIG